MPGQAHSGGGLVAAHRPGLGHDISVQRPADRLPQGGQAIELDVRAVLVVAHGTPFVCNRLRVGLGKNTPLTGRS